MAAEPKDTLLYALTRREHSVSELLKKLAQKHPELSRTEARDLVRSLTDAGLQSDSRFAEMLVRSRLGRGHGRRRIEQELSLHDIDPDTVAFCFDEMADDESDRALEALEKWARSKTSPSRDQALRFLAGRGFQFSDATKAIRTFFS